MSRPAPRSTSNNAKTNSLRADSGSDDLLDGLLGKDVAALDAVMDAASIQPAMLDAWMDRVIGAYWPKGHVLPEEAVKKVIRYILKADPDDEPPKENALDRFVKGCRDFEDEKDDCDDDDDYSGPLLRPTSVVYHDLPPQIPPTEE